MIVLGNNVISNLIPDMTPKQLQRFWNKVIKTGNCWIWTAHLNRGGYGQLKINYKTYSAHRISYTLFKDDIPKGLKLDHLCRNTACVNPEHLESVTQKENIRRGSHINKGIKNRQKTHCPKGHEYSGDNLYFDKKSRGCRTCQRNRNRNRRDKH